MIESSVRSAIGLDHEEGAANPTLDIGWIVVSVNLCRLIIFSRPRIKHVNPIGFKGPLSDRLRYVCAKLNTEAGKCRPLRVGQEAIKSPAVDAAIKVPIWLVDIVKLVFCARKGIGDLAINVWLLLFELSESVGASCCSHLSSEFTEGTSHAETRFAPA